MPNGHSNKLFLLKALGLGLYPLHKELCHIIPIAYEVSIDMINRHPNNHRVCAFVVFQIFLCLIFKGSENRLQYPRFVLVLVFLWLQQISQTVR